MPRVSRSAGPVLREGRAGVADRREHVERQHALRERRALAPQPRPSRQQPFAAGVLHPETGRGDRELAARRQTAAVRDGEERDAVEVDPAEPGVGVEQQIEEQVAAFVRSERHGAAGEEQAGRLARADGGASVLRSARSGAAIRQQRQERAAAPGRAVQSGAGRRRDGGCMLTIASSMILGCWMVSGTRSVNSSASCCDRRLCYRCPADQRPEGLRRTRPSRW